MLFNSIQFIILKNICTLPHNGRPGQVNLQVISLGPLTFLTFAFKFSRVMLGNNCNSIPLVSFSRKLLM